MLISSEKLIFIIFVKLFGQWIPVNDEDLIGNIVIHIKLILMNRIGLNVEKFIDKNLFKIHILFDDQLVYCFYFIIKI